MKGPQHQPFFLWLAAPDADDTSPLWQATTTGLVLLRFVDRRIECAADLTLIDPASPSHGPLLPVFEPDEAAAATRKVNALDAQLAVTAPLTALAQAVLYQPLAAAATPLGDYAGSLERMALWSLAVDVYDTILRLANAAPLRDTETFRVVRDTTRPLLRRARQLAAAPDTTTDSP